MKKAIVFLEQQSWLGGAQRVLEATLDAIAGEYDCVVAFPGPGPFRSALEARNIETIDLRIGDYRPGEKSWPEAAAFLWRSLYCGLKLAMVVRRRRIALIYINGPRCLPAGILAARLTRRPAVFHLHLILNRRLESALVARLSRRVSEIVACSGAAADSLSDRDRRLSPKIRVLHNPLPPSGIRRAVPSHRIASRFTVGIVGRVTETKGHHLLLRALGTLPSQLRDKVRILVVGSGAPGCEADRRYTADLRAEAVRQGLEEQIVWAGYQSDPGPYYASMDVLAHPALVEAMCLVILEALQQGVPVIAARTGGIPEVVKDGSNGLLVPPDDADALGEALRLFLENGVVRGRLQAGARAGLDSRFWPETYSAGARETIMELCGG